jgi:hypothetical protein
MENWKTIWVSLKTKIFVRVQGGWILSVIAHGCAVYEPKDGATVYKAFTVTRPRIAEIHPTPKSGKKVIFRGAHIIYFLLWQ